jgi:hypothetical protein
MSTLGIANTIAEVYEISAAENITPDAAGRILARRRVERVTAAQT